MRNHSKISRYLRECRLNTGISQGEIARTLGYSSAQFVSNWERGKSMPPMRAVPKLARLIKLNPNHLVDLYVEETGRILKTQFKSIKRK